MAPSHEMYWNAWSVMLRILVVEDDQGIQLLLHDIFTSIGWDVLSSSSAEGAWKLLSDRRPSVVLLDIRLADEMSGLDLLKRMREDASVCATPVVVCTGTALSESNLAEFTERGVPVVRKPFDIDHLIQTVRAAAGAELSEQA